MSEVLTTEEIDALLGAISAGADAEPKDERRYKIYDFKRPDIFSRDNIHQLSDIFESVCLSAENDLSRNFGTPCNVHLASVDQLTYEEIQRSFENPSYIALAERNGSPMLVECDFEILGALLKNYDEIKKSNLSSAPFNIPPLFDYLLGEKIAETILNEMWKAFYKDASRRSESNCHSELDRHSELVSESTGTVHNVPKLKVFCNPKEATEIPQNESCILVTLDVSFEKEDDDDDKKYTLVNFCFPSSFVKKNLRPLGICQKVKRENPFGHKWLHGNGYVALGWCNINEQNRKNLKVGTVVKFGDLLVHEPVPLVLKQTGMIFAEGEVILVDQTFAVRITEILAKQRKADETGHYGTWGLDILSGNAYLRLGEFEARKEEKIEPGQILELDTLVTEDLELVEKGTDKVIARGELLPAKDESYSLLVTEVLI